jgi:signal peptidase II
VRPSLLPWITALTVIAADRISKLLIVQHLEVGAYRPVFPGFALTHVHNRGIAFSLFADGGWYTRILLHAVILFAVVLIAWMLVHNQQRGWLPRIAFGLILGGAIGNLIDRVLHGYVVDFLHAWVSIGGRHWSWPDFNVADSGITVGACLLILYELRSGGAQNEGTDASDSD